MVMGKVSTSRWLLLLAQLPASPSSARVTLWRRLRAAGAASLQNGVWVLPRTAAHVALFEQQLEVVRQQGGSGVVLVASEQTSDANAIAQRFEADRAREYAEFSERCGGLLAEIAKETRREKFTFAELEEVEADLEKLTGWLAKIKARDFFRGGHVDDATEILLSCRAAIDGFARSVYDAEGIGAGPGAADVDKDNVATVTSQRTAITFGRACERAERRVAREKASRFARPIGRGLHAVGRS